MPNNLLSVTTIKILLIVSLASTSLLAFGKNKVQYRDLEWYKDSTPHFDLYYHKGAEKAAETGIIWTEKAYSEVRKWFPGSGSPRFPLIIMENPILFKQTNVISQIIPEGVAGFAEMFKNRIVIPFPGDYTDFRHVLHHELVHAFQYSHIYGDGLMQKFTVNLPLWFAEGSAEYFSSGWDVQADMFLRDITVNNRLPGSINQLSGYSVYKIGQSFFFYLEQHYGTEKLRAFFKRLRRNPNVRKTMEKTFEKPLEDIWKDWKREAKRLYWPELSGREAAEENCRLLTDTEESRSTTNLKPAVSPADGSIAFYSDRKDYIRVFVMDTSGEIKGSTGQFTTQGMFESFQPFRSGITWSPEGNRLAFITLKQGKNLIRIIDSESFDKITEYDPGVPFIFSPDWSPDGKSMIFCGLKESRTDIYSFDLKEEKTTRLTNSISTEKSPSFSPDGKHIVFSSADTCGKADRPFSKPSEDLFLLDLSDTSVSRITETSYNEHSPVFSPDGERIAFISDKSGVKNLYVMETENPEKIRRITNVIGGCFHPEWSPYDTSLVFSVFEKGAWNIAKINSPVKKSSGRPLEKTRWAEYREDSLEVFFKKSESLRTEKLSEMIPYRANHDSLDKGKERDLVLPAENPDAYTSGAAGTESTDKEEPESQEDISLKQNKYKPEFSPDGMSAGMAISPYYGYAGVGSIRLSDMLGNHTIGASFSLQGSLEEMYVFGSYLNSKHRLNFGIQGLLDRYYSISSLSDTLYYHETSFGINLILKYPLSMFARFGLSTYYEYVKKTPHILNAQNKLKEAADKEDKEVHTVIPTLEYVFDNILWGLTGPVNGIRARASASVSPPITEKGYSFAKFNMDIRGYWHIGKKFVWANRLAGGVTRQLGDKGNNSIFFLGGNQGWLFYEIDRSNYSEKYDLMDVASYVVPFRGWKYYELSGSRYGVFNTEFRFPFIREISLTIPPLSIKYINGAVFADFGNAWYPDQEYSEFPLPKKIFGGFGWGMRINLGIMALRYDMAWKTDWQNWVNSKARHYISLGAEF